MSLTIKCPNPACGKSGAVADKYAGQPVRCRFCRTTFTAAAADLQPISAAKDAPAAAPRQAPSSADADLPERIGRFLVRTVLGSGAFGTVYRASDPDLEREVALKVPQAATLNNPKHQERFLREARSAAKLHHPHIVPIYETGRDGDKPYIASAFIEGRTLADIIDSEPVDAQQAVRWVRALAEALAYAHKQGIVHRDVKPANIMIDGDAQPYLMDFGLAHQQDALSKLTHLGALLGTPAYIAPEQAKGQTRPPQPAGDQYSLGVMLYELLCGQTPFHGPPDIVLFNAIQTEPPPPRSVKPDIPAELERVCLKS